MANIDNYREYSNDSFNPVTVQNDGEDKVVFAFFEKNQFIPVHSPNSKLTMTVWRGEGILRTENGDQEISEGDVEVVEAGEPRGIKSDDSKLETIMVVSPPPGEEGHRMVERGIREGKFEPDIDQ
ncbi:MAG: cupin [Halobacteria archaeon]